MSEEKVDLLSYPFNLSEKEVQRRIMVAITEISESLKGIKVVLEALNLNHLVNK